MHKVFAISLWRANQVIPFHVFKFSGLNELIFKSPTTQTVVLSGLLEFTALGGWVVWSCLWYCVFRMAGAFIRDGPALSCYRDIFVVHWYNKNLLIFTTLRLRLAALRVTIRNDLILLNINENDSNLCYKFRSSKPCKIGQHVGSCTCKALACLPGHRVQIRGWPMLNKT